MGRCRSSRNVATRGRAHAGAYACAGSGTSCIDDGGARAAATGAAHDGGATARSGARLIICAAAVRIEVARTRGGCTASCGGGARAHGRGAA